MPIHVRRWGELSAMLSESEDDEEEEEEEEDEENRTDDVSGMETPSTLDGISSMVLYTFFSKARIPLIACCLPLFGLGVRSRDA